MQQTSQVSMQHFAFVSPERRNNIHKPVKAVTVADSAGQSFQNTDPVQKYSHTLCVTTVMTRSHNSNMTVWSVVLFLLPAWWWRCHTTLCVLRMWVALVAGRWLDGRLMAPNLKWHLLRPALPLPVSWLPTVPCHAMPCSTVQYSTVQCSTVQCSTVPVCALYLSVIYRV